MGNFPRAVSIGFTVVRYTFEAAVALTFFLFAAEQYTHRTFSDDIRYKAIVTSFAVMSGILGLLPLLAHISPRFGKRAFVAWLVASVVLLLLIGLITKPYAGRLNPVGHRHGPAQRPDRLRATPVP